MSALQTFAMSPSRSATAHRLLRVIARCATDRTGYGQRSRAAMGTWSDGLMCDSRRRVPQSCCVVVATSATARDGGTIAKQPPLSARTRPRALHVDGRVPATGRADLEAGQRDPLLGPSGRHVDRLQVLP